MGKRTRCGILAILIVLGSALPAKAFYWRGWPATVRVVDRTIIPSDDYPNDSPTPIFPPPDYTFPTVPVGPPIQTPEPATGLIALLGLGTVAAMRKLRKN